jgi:hypothetical protein
MTKQEQLQEIIKQAEIIKQQNDETAYQINLLKHRASQVLEWCNHSEIESILIDLINLEL